MNLTEKAMLTRLTLRAWTGRRTDRAAARETATNHSADPDSLSTSVRLVDRNPVLTVQRAHAAARKTHNHLTAPWDDSGDRILPSAHFRRHTEAMRDARTAVEAAVSDLLAAYPAMRAAAPRRLGSLFDPSDYPATDDLASRFAFELSYQPVPSGEDFRVTLSEEEMNDLRSSAEHLAADRAAAAMRDTFSRVSETVSRLVRQLSDPRAKVYETLLGDAAALVDVLPALNLTNDPQLTEITAQLKAELVERYTTAELRDNDFSRAEAAAAANSIARKLAGVI
jgi:hypothetical protein